MFPEIAKEWHPTKNGSLKSQEFLTGSNKKIWWRCTKGHQYIAPISRRTQKNSSGCPFCKNKKVTKDEWEIFLKVAPTDFQPNFGDSQSNMLYNQSRGGLYKGDMPIFYYHYIERIFDKLETIYKQKNEGGDNTKSGDIPLDLMDVLFATALAISPSESLIKRATGIFDVALLLTDDKSSKLL